MENTKFNCVVVGGAGHIGVPISLALGHAGVKVLIYDINNKALVSLKNNSVPFLEEGAEPILKKLNSNRTIGYSSDSSDIKNIKNIIVTVGTPIDEYHNPQLSLLTNCLDSFAEYLNENQTIILRSTVSPGVTDYLFNYLKKKYNINMNIAFCPERIVQGKGLEEIKALPQIISGTSDKAVFEAKKLFSKISPKIIEANTKEAEFSKLICNSFRYIEFAATNQLYMLAETEGINYNKILKLIKEDYPRTINLPGPGFAGGPCLMKDTLQLFSLGKHKFPLGQTAVSINESLPNFIIDQLKLKYNSLFNKKIGILGMAFKADSDDIRDALSYKLAKLLRFEGSIVLYSDEYVADTSFVSSGELINNCEIIVVGVPHKQYKNLKIPKHIDLIDMWHVIKQ